jgi:acetyl esterase/lipase
MRGLILTILVSLAGAYGLMAQGSQPNMVSWQVLSGLPPKKADKIVKYGSDSLQFGELRMPRSGTGKFPVAVIIHGGCWLSQFNLSYMSHVSEALRQAGFATWTLEFKRVGDAGGGWPGTLLDVAQGTDYLRELAKEYPLDLREVVLVGHSAGGQLALWLAARKNLKEGSPLFSADPLPIRGVLTLAGITDLAAYAAEEGSCNAAVAQFMGGLPADVPERYAEASPVQLLPLRVPQRLLLGTQDPIVPLSQSSRYAARAKAKGDDVQEWALEATGHFDLVAPFSSAWFTVEKAAISLVSPGKARKYLKTNRVIN